MRSPIDEIYESIFGEIPKKSGSAFERLSAIAMHVLNEGEVTHDKNLRGVYSGTNYQLDVHHLSATDNTVKMGEAKDYSIKQKPVGRGDLQKLGGALPDLEQVSEGAFFSATGYTGPARKYAEGTLVMPGAKPISLFELSPATPQDEVGFVKTIVINMHLQIPHPEKGAFIPVLTESGTETLKRSFLKSGEESFTYQVGLEAFFDQDGRQIMSLGELTSIGYGEVNSDSNIAYGCYRFDSNYHIDVSGVLAQIRGLEYRVPYSIIERELRISDDSNCRIAIRDKNGMALRIISDEIIRRFSFDDDGRLVKR